MAILPRNSAAPADSGESADPARIVFPLMPGPPRIERQTTEPERPTAKTWMARFAVALRHAIQTRYGERAETMVEADASSWTTVFATKGFTAPGRGDFIRVKFERLLCRNDSSHTFPCHQGPQAARRQRKAGRLRVAERDWWRDRATTPHAGGGGDVTIQPDAKEPIGFDWRCQSKLHLY